MFGHYRGVKEKTQRSKLADLVYFITILFY
jgi:hypothetical protein